MAKGSWFARQLAGARSGLAEESFYAEKKGGRDLRDVESAHPLSRLISRHAETIAQAPWRVRLGHALESHKAHMLIMALVVFDLIAVFGEVMLTNVCGIEREKAIAKFEDESHAEASAALQREERIHAWEGGLHKFSIAIVIVLIVYVVGLLIAFGRKFFGKVWYLLDAAVLIVTLVLEFTLTEDSSGFLPIILSWRVLRILHGFFVTEESSTTEVLELQGRLEAARKQAAWDESDDVASLRRRLGSIGAMCVSMRAEEGAGGDELLPSEDTLAFAKPSPASSSDNVPATQCNEGIQSASIALSESP